MKRLLLSLCATVALCASAYASPHSYIEADSITDNMQDFNYLTSYTEANYAAFPAIISNGFGSQYNAMKTSLKEAVGSGSMGIRQAACEYAFCLIPCLTPTIMLTPTFSGRSIKEKTLPTTKA